MTTFRGAGRPEAAQAIERMVDLFAAEIGMDPVEVRRKNFIPKDAFPYTDRDGGGVRLWRLRGRARPRAARGRATRSCAPSSSGCATTAARCSSGSGSARTREITNPLGEEEYGEVEITADGGAIVHTGSFSHGQGHETTFAMIAAERLGLPIERITVRQGRHGRRRPGHGHVRVEVDADRRHGGQRRRRRGRRAREGARRRLPRGERGRRRPRHGRGPVPRRRNATSRRSRGRSSPSGRPATAGSTS